MSTANRDSSSLIKRRKQAVLYGFDNAVKNTTVKVAGYNKNPSQSSSYVQSVKQGRGECCNGYPRSCDSNGNALPCNPGAGCGC
jgi:ethanolamine utilization microcompartment shell protein EutL